ncbi:hypothetical protein SDC9_157061 [bioreactor metagenome]|uniref:Uncharacterized protein n=1 Tax=bioreactor metagenome TaxID=1076179 RepID=A0A645F8W3_9ZZZZ
MILNGNAIIDGGNITMPIDINVLDTTMSIIKNGMNSKKPMVNARFSSLVTKAGTTISRPRSVSLSLSVERLSSRPVLSLEIETNMLRSLV